MVNPLRSVSLVCVLVTGSLAGQTAATSLNADTPAAAASAAAERIAVAPMLTNTLMDGTAVKLRLFRNLDSATAKVGQAVAFEVVDEVKVQGVTVIAREAQALGTVTMAQGKRRMARGGKLNVNLDSVCLVDGEKAALRATASGKGGGPVVEMTTMMVLTGVLFLPAAPLFLLKHGKDVTIPEGTEVTGFVSGDVLLDMAKFVPVAAPGTTAAGAALLTTLAVDSSIAESDIEVDGVFVGKTPSTIAVTPGPHTIAVKKKDIAIGAVW